MESTVVYANLVLTCGLGVLVAAVTARLTQARRALQLVARDIVTEETIVSYLEGIVEERLEAALERIFDDRTARIAELREELRRSVRRETQDALERSEFHQTIERAIQDKLTRGAFATHVKQTLDEHYKSLASYVENDVVPRLMTKKFAESDRILLGKGPTNRVV